MRSIQSPISGREPADELENSLSTLYCDMAELHAQRIPITSEAGDNALLRHPLRERSKLQRTYINRGGNESGRIIWPLLIAFMDPARYLIA